MREEAGTTMDEAGARREEAGATTDGATAGALLAGVATIPMALETGARTELALGETTGTKVEEAAAIGAEAGAVALVRVEYEEE